MKQAMLIGMCCLTAMVSLCTIPAADAASGPDANRGVMGIDGRLRLQLGGEDFCTLNPVAASPQWQFGNARAISWTQEGQSRRFAIKVGDASIAGEAILTGSDGRANATWTFTSDRDVDLACLAVSMDFAASVVIGGTWQADGERGQRGERGTFPAQLDKVGLFNAPVRSFGIMLSDGRSLSVSFAEPTPLLVQDNRQWSQTFSIRIGQQGAKLARGKKYVLSMTLATDAALATQIESPTVITAGAEWIPLKTELEIEPGSALDFSGLGFADGPAGKYGRVIVTPDGHFAFEKRPDQPRRFYGVNFCFSALYQPKAQVDLLCDRLVRLGYNTIRVHHYESALTDGKPGFEWKPEALDQLDYLMAACVKRGIYVTTDLYVSRPVGGQQVAKGDGKIAMDEFKVLVPVHEPAFRDWESFTRKLLAHVNPHTGRRWADEPALAWLSMINEGNFGNYWKDVKAIPQWTEAWNRWLVGRYKDRAALAAAWGDELKSGEDCVAGSVALPDGVYGESVRHRDVVIFIGELERDMFLRMKKFLHEDIKCQALLTNMNSWTNHVPNQFAREEFDYVDDHFYVDHPQFIERPWSLPSRCDNANPIKSGAPGGCGGNAVRLLGKPFTVSEYNYSGPGRFRGVGGILTGAKGALQDWDVIWRFAYSHSRDNLFVPATMGYFDLVTDPLNQAADRAAVMLYLRGDLKPAAHTIAMALTAAELENPPKRVPVMGEGPTWATWITRLGSAIGDPAKMPRDWIALPAGWNDSAKDLTAFGTDRAKLMQTLRDRGVIARDNPSDPAKKIYQTDTGEMMMDAKAGLLRFDTPCSAGGYADPGTMIASPKAGVEIADLSVGATVFVTSVDSLPIRSSRRVLVMHLTDLQNTDSTYAESSRQVLLTWGKLPHLVHAGSATVRLSLASAEQYKVYSLSTSGRRVGEVPAKVEGGKLVFTCDVGGAEGARMMYEVVR